MPASPLLCFSLRRPFCFSPQLGQSKISPQYFAQKWKADSTACSTCRWRCSVYIICTFVNLVNRVLVQAYFYPQNPEERWMCVRLNLARRYRLISNRDGKPERVRLFHRNKYLDLVVLAKSKSYLFHASQGNLFFREKTFQTFFSRAPFYIIFRGMPPHSKIAF